MIIKCPHCGKEYPLARTCLAGLPNQAFTIICEECEQSFDGHFEESPGAPATTMYRWSFGWFGQPAIESEVFSVTRKRLER